MNARNWADLIPLDQRDATQKLPQTLDRVRHHEMATSPALDIYTDRPDCAAAWLDKNKTARNQIQSKGYLFDFSFLISSLVK
mmetsp:Transcript_9552/g.20750  ORF Transcript_9552/g.20750 Transcript_9552/m.20750 type:complete len:82 (-) Transcript_9552:163-408(-)